MNETPRGGNGATEWRLRSVERRLDNLESVNPAVVAERIRQLEDRVKALDQHTNSRMNDLDAGQSSLMRAVVGGALTVAGGASLFSFTVWQVFG